MYLDMEHHINFNFSAPYYTLNELTDRTTDLWIACHGFGQMAKHFIRRFDAFDNETHFVVAPQGLSRFYMDNYQKVGASWMTKEDMDTEKENQRRYFDAVMADALKGRSLVAFNVHLFGFSQGVSMISRMAAYAKIDFKNLIAWAGSFPNELEKGDFAHLGDHAGLTVVVGEQDELVPQNEKFDMAVKHAENILGLEANIVKFQGGHEMNRAVLSKLSL